MTEERKKIKTLLFLFLLGSFFFIFSPFCQAQTVLFQEDFETNLNQWEILSGGGSVSLTSEQKQSGNQSLKLNYNGQETIIVRHLFNSPLQMAKVTVYFFDDLQPKGSFVGIYNQPSNTTPREETEAIILGVHPSYENYYYRASTNISANGLDSHVPRSRGWHKFELVVTPKGAYGIIDDINLSYLQSFGSKTPFNIRFNAIKEVLFAATWGTAGVSYFDNLKITPFPSLPPTILEREYQFIKWHLNEYPPNSQQLPPGADFNQILTSSRTMTNAALLLAIEMLRENKTNNLVTIKNLLTTVNEISLNLPSSCQPGENFLSYTNPAIPAYTFGLSAWLIWPKLDNTTRLMVKNYLLRKANCYLQGNPASGYIDDTKAEENAWVASFFALAANMFPHEEKHTAWEEKGKLWAFHTFTTGETYGGIFTQTLYPDFTLANHGWHPHTQYYFGGSVTPLGEGALTYLKTGKAIPEEFKHNLRQTWEAHRSLIDYQTFLFTNSEMSSQFGGKDDWGVDATAANIGLAYLQSLNIAPSIMDELTAFEYYIRFGVSAFPKKAQPLLPRYQTPYPSDLQYLVNSVVAKRHATTLIFLDPQIRLTPVGDEPTDLNQDGFLNSKDWTFLLRHYRISLPKADVNQDNIVNSLDFPYFFKNIADFLTRS